MTGIRRLQQTLRDTKVVSVHAVFTPRWIRAEWERVGTDELRECYTADVLLRIRSQEITVHMGKLPRISPGEIPISSMVEIIRELVEDAGSIKLNNLQDTTVRDSLNRVMSDIASKYDERIESILGDRQALDTVHEALQRRKKKVAAKAVQSVFRKAVQHMTTEEIHELWDLSQVEAVLTT